MGEKWLGNPMEIQHHPRPFWTMSCSISTGSDLQQVFCNAWDRDRNASSGHQWNSGKWMIITIQSLGCLGSLGSLFSPNHWNVWKFFNGKFEIPRWKLWSSALYWLVWLPIFINQMGLLRLAIYYKMLGPIFHEWIDGYPLVSSNVVSWQIYTIDDTGE